jgi:proteasome assembly chaperone (PAC2) family protein
MNQNYLHIHSKPTLNDPIFIAGLPGIGNIGKLVSELMIQKKHAKVFAELYSPAFPDYVFIDQNGVCRPPRYEFYASITDQNLVILTGDCLPTIEDISAYYELCEDILDFVIEFGCKSLATIGGIPISYPTKEVYIATSNKEMAKKFIENGAISYKSGNILGFPGLLLGLGSSKGLNGFCLLGLTLGLTTDRESAFRIYKLLNKVLSVK